MQPQTHVDHASTLTVCICATSVLPLLNTLANLFCRSDPKVRSFSAAEVLRWLTQHKNMQQQEAKQTLSALQQAHQISTVSRPEVDLGSDLGAEQLLKLQLQLVNAAPAPTFGQPLNVHYVW